MKLETKAELNVEKKLIVQGRQVTPDDITLIKDLMKENSSWHRTRLSQEICRKWDWYKENGQMKDMACRSLLLKLERAGYIELPPSRTPCTPRIIKNHSGEACRPGVEPVLHSKKPIHEPLKILSPIEIRQVEKGYDLKLFKYFISTYHYLGWSGTVGENLKYLFMDRFSRPLGCMMFGAAAWKTQPRDTYIGWDSNQRERNLSWVANNNRFLILPWVNVKYLASHLLSRVVRCINRDWQKKYCHPIYLLETFVEKERFKGTCYRAANWVYLGETQGRGKMDRYTEHALPVKDIWIYSLDKTFRQKLCDR